jgi:hypothetical protein
MPHETPNKYIQVNINIYIYIHAKSVFIYTGHEQSCPVYIKTDITSQSTINNPPSVNIVAFLDPPRNFRSIFLAVMQKSSLFRQQRVEMRRENK